MVLAYQVRFLLTPHLDSDAIFGDIFSTGRKAAQTLPLITSLFRLTDCTRDLIFTNPERSYKYCCELYLSAVSILF